MKITEELQDRADKIQKEAHEYVNNTIKILNKNEAVIVYDDIMNMYLYTKIAEMEKKIEELENLTFDLKVKNYASNELLKNRK